MYMALVPIVGFTVGAFMAVSGAFLIINFCGKVMSSQDDNDKKLYFTVLPLHPVRLRLTFGYGLVSLLLCERLPCCTNLGK